MLEIGRVERYIHEKLKREKLHFVLLDPDDVSPETAGKIAEMSEAIGVDAIMVGGSTGAEGCDLVHIERGRQMPSDETLSSRLIHKSIDALYG